MELDAKRFHEGTTLDTDVCIIGAGPAGLVLAAELVDKRCDVIVIESGGHRAEAQILALNVGETSGDVYAGLSATRHRGVGGTAQLWNSAIAGRVGAKYAPLDAGDFEPRPGREHTGWPFGFGDLRADYERAQNLCGIGPFAYDGAAWADALHQPWSALRPALVSRVYQTGTRDALLSPLLASIARATNVRLCTHASAVALRGDPSGRNITRVSIATPGGARWTLRAKRVVLAAGAVENARMLLLTDDGSGALGNASGWVGRGFMEHPRDRALTLHPRTPDLYSHSVFYDRWRAGDGTWLIGRLALDHTALGSEDLLNASATLFPRASVMRRRLRAASPSIVTRWLWNEGHGWSRAGGGARVYDGFTVMLNVEQTPHPENRVTLSTRCDSLGVPLAALHWSWHADDHSRLERLRARFATELEVMGTVTIDRVTRPDPNAHHHAGTTRMHADSRHGVTDMHGRVHGTDNVYVAGASTFPTAGFVNPMLTIVALSVRLARHLLATS
ncbi:MAG TPA: GMC family oxidoreductase [Gemmatimonadaceae bacterium]